MKEEGPPLQTLLHRLAECPPEFLEEPQIGRQGKVCVAAVVSDLLRDAGGSLLSQAQAVPFESDVGEARNRLRLILIASWFFHDQWFRMQGVFAQRIYEFLVVRLDELAALVDAEKFVTDPDRREELARLCLHGLGLRPLGETVAQAQDRLTTLNTAERTRVMRETRAAEERARQIREAMQKKAAEEAAAKYNRE